MGPPERHTLFNPECTPRRGCVHSCILFAATDFDVLFSLLTCGNYDFRYDLAKGLRPRSVVKTAMAHDLMMFAITQKDGLGMDRAIEEAKFRMSRYSVTPDMLIVPPQLSLYLSTAPNEKTLFVDGGSKAVAEFESGRAGFETRAYRSLGVVSSEPVRNVSGRPLAWGHTHVLGVLSVQYNNLPVWH